MKSYNIAVIGGDGTGPEVVREAVGELGEGVGGGGGDEQEIGPVG